MPLPEGIADRSVFDGSRTRVPLRMEGATVLDLVIAPSFPFCTDTESNTDDFFNNMTFGALNVLRDAGVVLNTEKRIETSESLRSCGVVKEA